MRSADVIVVGAGVIGASIAWHLAKAGVPVHLVDQSGPAAAPGATWASAGGLRSQGRHGPEQALSLAAARRWPTLAEELDADLEISLGGHLHIAETEAEQAAVAARVAEDRAAGLDIHLVEGAALREIVPGLTPRALSGAWTPGDGQAHPGRVAAACTAAAVRLGARTRFGAVARPVVRGDRVVAVDVGGVRLAADRVVLATGAWSVGLLAGLGLHLPLRWRGLQMLLSEVAAPSLQPTVTGVGRNLSLKQTPSGQFMVGGRWLAEPVGESFASRPFADHVARQWATACAVLPELAGLAVAQVWSGAEAQSLDALPFIGPAGPEGLYLAAGFSNHGFQISPAVGAAVAEDLLSGPAPLLAAFRPERAAGVDPARAAAFATEPLLC
ncbi:NAD(P)/FAD-dependent oxidoreductase [Segnochrobactraceae bacterium EtOH-i3]